MSVEYLPQLGVAGNRLYSKDGTKAVTLNLLLEASLKLKHRGVLQVEKSEATAIAVLQRITDLGGLAAINDLMHRLGQSIKQSAKS